MRRGSAGLTRVVGVLAVAASVLAIAAAPASAAPDPEGGTKTLRAALESAAKGHIEATRKLAASQKRQKELQATLLQTQAETKKMESRIAAVAGRSYRLGRVNTMTLLLNAGSPDAFLERVQRLDMMAQLDGRAMTRYRDAIAAYTKAKTANELEIREQQKQVTILAKKKKEAELALASVGGGSVAGGFVGVNSPLAKPAPRGSDGSWPKERCTVDDPTTSGCITPRLLNAYQQARAAGFKHYTSCFSERASGEHPQGRACDFAAAQGGFENKNAAGSDKVYGNNLAAYFVKNADRLGVLYVIWFRQIWMPGTGWRAYSGSGGPSATHTNHVHLSII
ncbi:coiled-coil domain-containing protein [Actinoplanes sp. NPDC049265]|uniref:coiled-coil domain-containing protein n=1 Tax=Actinoplanes sp. NPDC049265 TaxID=3363902 RepID=UPI00371C6985